MLKFAAIDIGSNAVRLQVSRVSIYEGQISFKKLEYVRFPLRLGVDVFSTGKISPAFSEKFKKLMHAYKLLIELYEVDDYMGCATSAMRESKNGALIVEEVRKQLDLEITIIDGDREAEIIDKAIFPYMNEKAHLHIDVGGGSTELNLYVNQQKVKSKSFPIGSVRSLQPNEQEKSWKELDNWLHTEIKKEFGSIKALGTGGNINKVLDLSGKKAGKAISIHKVEEMKDYIASFSMDDRINKLQLNPDRADVIIPALNIYIRIMELAKCKSILVPDSGLKDGIMQLLFEKNREKFPEFSIS